MPWICTVGDNSILEQRFGVSGVFPMFLWRGSSWVCIVSVGGVVHDLLAIAALHARVVRSCSGKRQTLRFYCGGVLGVGVLRAMWSGCF